MENILRRAVERSRLAGIIALPIMAGVLLPCYLWAGGLRDYLYEGYEAWTEDIPEWWRKTPWL